MKRCLSMMRQCQFSLLLPHSVCTLIHTNRTAWRINCVFRGRELLSSIMHTMPSLHARSIPVTTASASKHHPITIATTTSGDGRSSCPSVTKRPRLSSPTSSLTPRPTSTALPPSPHPLALPVTVLAVASLTAVDVPTAAASTADFFRHAEPTNALSLPTWAVHTSSVIEWMVGMGLMWRYAEASGNPRWKGMTWGMLPCLGSAMCACTWHFFYNSPDLEFLVTLQAALTVLGNFTCWIAAYRIFEGAKAEGKI